MGLRRLRILGLHSGPEPGGSEPARFQVGILVSVVEERGLVDLADQISGDRPWPHPGELRLPQLAEKPRAAQDVPVFRKPEPRVVEQRRGLHRPRRSVVRRVERGDPFLRRQVPIAGEPARGSGQFQEGAALVRAGGFFERAGRFAMPAQLEEREAAPERVVIVGQVLEPARLKEVARVVHDPQTEHKGAALQNPGRASVAWYTPLRRRRTPPMLRGVDAFARLANVTWSALRSVEVIPVLARVLDGEPAEREIDRFLRARRWYEANERAAAVEAIFGVGLWRRRLGGHTPSAGTRRLLFALLRDLAGMPEPVAGALCDLGPPWPPRRPEPERLADRWSLPDSLEAILLRELGSEAEAFAEAISVPGPICLRANALRTCRAYLAGRLREEGVETVETQSAPHGLLVTTARPNLLALASFREGLFEVQDEGSQLVAALCAARA